MSKYWQLQESYQWCDEIGDFFENPLVRRAYWELWNIHFVDKINPRDFTISNPHHLDFVREVFMSESLSPEFLLRLKLLSQRFKNIKQFKYSTTQIVSFLLIWSDIQWRVNTYPESLSSIFSEKVLRVLDDSWSEIIYRDKKYSFNKYQWTRLLVELWIMPCDENGFLIYWFWWDADNWYVSVTNEQWDMYNIDLNWNKLTPEDTNNLILWNLQALGDLIEEAIWILENWWDIYNLPNEIKQIIESKRNLSSKDTILKFLKKRQSKLAKHIVHRRDVGFSLSAQRFGITQVPQSYLH